MKHAQLTLVVLMLLSTLLGGCDLSRETKGKPEAIPMATIREWHYLDPIDSNAPTLLEASDDTEAGAFRLTRGWEVASVEYIYAWRGLGEPRLDHQVIRREGTSYKLGNSVVAPGDVQALVHAIDHLYPAQLRMEGHAWTDDYPSWAVEITGTDGQHVLLFASSVGNPGNGPWSVMYNGRLYAQYDGLIATPLGMLFGGGLGENEYSYLRYNPEGRVEFKTVGLPSQLAYGFWGLLPISDGFSYTADANTGEIRGRIKGCCKIARMTISQVSKLDSIQLSTPGGAQMLCKTALLPEDDPWTWGNGWQFACPKVGVSPGQRYHDLIKVRFGTDKGDSVDVAGELWGTWKAWPATNRRDYIVLPPPPEIEAALIRHPIAQNLLSDHTLGAARYSAAIFTETKPLRGRRSGEAILFGQTEVDGKQVRYTVGAQFVLEDGKLVYWDLDRPALDNMLRMIRMQPLTKRVLERNPQAVINMWYANGVPSHWYEGSSYLAQVNSCGAVPVRSFPTTDKPLQAFGYNIGPYFRGAPFVLIDGEPVVSELMLYPDHADPLYPDHPDLVQKALLPEALDTGANRPFVSLFMESAPPFEDGPTLRIQLPLNALPQERAMYTERLKALPVTAEAGETEGEMVVRGVTFAVRSDGMLQVVSCST